MVSKNSIFRENVYANQRLCRITPFKLYANEQNSDKQSLPYEKRHLLYFTRALRTPHYIKLEKNG